MPYFRNLALVSALAATVLVHAAPIQWTVASGGNGHFYDLVSGALTYAQAKANALGLSYMGMPGHLAQWEDANRTSGGLSELGFLNQNFTPSSASAPSGVWLGGESNGVSDPFRYSTGGLADTSGFAIDFAEGNVPEGLLIANISGSTVDGDYAASNPAYGSKPNLVTGYVVEYTPTPTPEPSALAALGLGAAAFVRKRRKG